MATERNCRWCNKTSKADPFNRYGLHFCAECNGNRNNFFRNTFSVDKVYPNLVLKVIYKSTDSAAFKDDQNDTMTKYYKIPRHMFTKEDLNPDNKLKEDKLKYLELETDHYGYDYISYKIMKVKVVYQLHHFME